MKLFLRISVVIFACLGSLASAQSFSSSSSSALTFQHPRDQIALQLGAIQMGYTVPFQLVSGNATKAQQAANALLMGRNALAATVAKPAVKVQGFVSSPSVDTVEYRDQLYQAVEAVVTSPVVGSIKGSVSVVGSTKAVPVSASLAVPPNAYTIPVPYALEAATSVDAQTLSTQVGTLSSNLTTVQGQTTALSANVGTLQTQTANITSAIGSLGTNIQSLQNQNTALAGNLTSVQSQTAALSSNLGTLQTQGSVVEQELITIITRHNVASVSTLTGTANAGFADGDVNTARFAYPTAIAEDFNNGIRYVADHYNHRIRKITPQGVVSTLAGSGNAGFADGNGTSASFNYPTGVAVDSSGNVYVGDLLNNRVRKITSGGVVTTFAGNGTAGFADGNGTSAMFNYPSGLAVDASGNVYVADRNNCRIRKITQNGEVSTLAGSGVAGFSDGNATNARFGGVDSVAVDVNGTVYVADTGNKRIRKISTDGFVTTLAGNGTSGFADGNGQNAMLTPAGVAVDANGVVYVGDYDNNRVRRVSPAGFVTTLAGNGSAGSEDGDGQSASFNRVYGLAVDSSGQGLYVVDQNNSRIRTLVLE